MGACDYMMLSRRTPNLCALPAMMLWHVKRSFELAGHLLQLNRSHDMTIVSVAALLIQAIDCAGACADSAARQSAHSVDMMACRR